MFPCEDTLCFQYSLGFNFNGISTALSDTVMRLLIR